MRTNNTKPIQTNTKPIQNQICLISYKPNISNDKQIKNKSMSTFIWIIVLLFAISYISTIDCNLYNRFEDHFRHRFPKRKLSYPAFGDIEVEQYVENQYSQYYVRSDPFHKFMRRVYYFKANSCSGKCDSEGQCDRDCSCLAITYGSGICVASQVE